MSDGGHVVVEATMPYPFLSISELFKVKAVTNEQVNAAAEAYLNDALRAAYELAPAVTIDLSDAVEKHEPARRALANPEASLAFRRTMVRTAILLERFRFNLVRILRGRRSLRIGWV